MLAEKPVPDSSHGSSSWFPQKFLFPRFSNSTLTNIERKSVTKSVRINVTESLGQQMWVHTKYPLPAEYTGVLEMLLNKYPVLGDCIGNGIVSFH